ncbi:MAG: hypothetical protein EHM57_05095 [Actinobacteria bacterium]|nr:MAG: hypothetical protein EHM57_05095 [Actinomycetota bacterium]
MTMQRASLILPAIVAALALAACGAGDASGSADPTAPVTTTTAAPPQPLLQADLIGGCFMMGPNCVRYVIYDDASVEAHRLGNEAPELLWVAAIDESLVADLDAALAGADLEELRSRLGPGTCNACVDGIDTVLTITRDGAETVFDSAQVEFETSEPVFAAADRAVQAAAATGEVVIIQR